jgi:hypothetical protein
MGFTFISYSHRDKDYADMLASSLQGRGIDVWIDARLDYGSQWPNEIQKQLDLCDAFILIMTPRSFESEWVQSELQRAKRKSKPIFPLLLEGDEPWLSVESTQYYDVQAGELPDNEFYLDLERVVLASQTGRGDPQTLKPDKKIVPEKEKQPRKKAGGVFALIGCMTAILGLCLVSAFLWFQKEKDNNATSSLLVTGTPPNPLENTTPNPAIALTSLPFTPTVLLLPAELPDGPTVMMMGPSGNKYQYTILSAERLLIDSDKFLLRLHIRTWTDNGGGMNFWSDSFRLVVGDLRLAPENLLNEIVKRDETVEGDVEFEIDTSIKEAVLVITVYPSESWSIKELRLVFP